MTNSVYRREHELVSELTRHLGTELDPWSCRGFTLEFDYTRGRTDVVVITADDRVIALEAKLDRWREALQQAYRNTCFAHQSYVLLPRPAADRALRFTVEFERRGVGICVAESDQVEILLEARHDEPLQLGLAMEAAVAANETVQ